MKYFKKLNNLLKNNQITLMQEDKKIQYKIYFTDFQIILETYRLSLPKIIGISPKYRYNAYLPINLFERILIYFLIKSVYNKQELLRSKETIEEINKQLLGE